MAGPFTDVDPVLLFAGLDLLGVNEHEGADFELEATGADLTFGNPAPIDVVIASQLQDGSIVHTQRHDNREIYLRVKVTAGDATGLQAGEDALAQACGRRTTLEWTPPDGSAATTVFKIHTAHLEHVADDLEERRNTRHYGLRMVAAPYTRSAERVSLEAIPDAAVFAETSVDQCTSTTGWTASDALTLVGGTSVRSTKSGAFAADPYSVWLERSGSFTVPVGEEYVRIEYAKTFNGYIRLTVDTLGPLSPIAKAGGFAWFAVPAGTYSTLRFTGTHNPDVSPPGKPSTFQSVTVSSVYTTNVAGFNSRKELSRSFGEIPGSVRAPGDLIVSHPSNGLGDVLIYVYPDLGGYSPSLQPWRTGGGSTTADTTVSGKREPLNGTPTFEIPVGNLPPGAYHVLARVRHTSTTAFQVTLSSEVAGTTVTRTATLQMDAANAWQVVAIGTEHLPPVRVRDDSDRLVTLTLTTATSGVEFDAGWLFRANEIGTPTALIQVAAGSEMSVTFQAADVETPQNLLFIDDYFAGDALGSLEAPSMTPPDVNVTIVTTGTDDAEAVFDFYPHWFGHAGL